MDAPQSIVVRPVDDHDQPAVLELVRPFVQQQKVLARTIDELATLWPNSFVAVTSAGLAGFAALDIYSAKLAEIRSLVVAESYQGRGIGKRLVAACLERARERAVMEVMAISSSESFFRSCGFDFTLPGEKKAFFFQVHPWR